MLFSIPSLCCAEPLMVLVTSYTVGGGDVVLLCCTGDLDVLMVVVTLCRTAVLFIENGEAMKC